MRSARALRFENRADAGRKLAERLASLRLDRPVVLGLPRGGIPVAAEVASLLGGPLEAFVARKVGAPGHEEFGIGAVAEGLEEPIMSETAAAFAPGSERLRAMVERSYRELSRQVALYRGDRALPELAGRQVVLVDDGLATGVTAEAALVALRRRRPSRLVLGVPVCAPQSAARLASRAEDVVCVQSPARFVAVSYWYHDFLPTTDQEIIDLLAQRRADLSTEQ
ncbi:MAG TPA: phosphoribosyltransferase family protein [Acidimicrobiales bacterium]|nr:phosphoribosyltransferase family protein [Acidimicrobiales bacterium]